MLNKFKNIRKKELEEYPAMIKSLKKVYQFGLFLFLFSFAFLSIQPAIAATSQSFDLIFVSSDAADDGIPDEFVYGTLTADVEDGTATLLFETNLDVIHYGDKGGIKSAYFLLTDEAIAGIEDESIMVSSTTLNYEFDYSLQNTVDGFAEFDELLSVKGNKATDSVFITFTGLDESWMVEDFIMPNSLENYASLHFISIESLWLGETQIFDRNGETFFSLWAADGSRNNGATPIPELPHQAMIPILVLIILGLAFVAIRSFRAGIKQLENN